MRAVAVLTGLLLLASACTSDPAPPAAPEPVKHTPAPRVPDRDEKAVLNALVNLDPCALAGAPDARRRHPHLCIIDLPDTSSVHIAVNDRSAHASQYNGATKEIGGAKVQGISAPTPDLCQASIPVSFEYAITIAVLPGPANHGCVAGDVDKYAAKVIAGLGKQGKVQHPANRPDLSKDACTVVDAAMTYIDVEIGPDTHHTRTDIDDCFLSVPSFTDGSVNFGMLIEPGPPEGGWGTKWATVRGKTIYVNQDSDGCRWTWSQGNYSGNDNRLMTLSADTCKHGDNRVKQMLGSIITQLEKPQVPGTVPHLTYRPDEPDEPNPGACVDYPAETCDPYQPTPVSTDVSAGAMADPYVTCAATLDAVGAQFPGMRPVVDTSQQPGCSYVQADHALRLDFRVYGSPWSVLQEPSPRPITVAGHPATYAELRSNPQLPSTSICVETGKQNPKTSGNYDWCVTAAFQAPRNKPSGKPDTSVQTKLAPLMAAVAAKF